MKNIKMYWLSTGNTGSVRDYNPEFFTDLKAVGGHVIEVCTSSQSNSIVYITVELPANQGFDKYLPDEI